MSKIIIKKGMVSRKMGNKTVFFDGENSLLYTLNETATEIFKKLSSGLSREATTVYLKLKYGIKHKKAKRDVNVLIKDLVKQKIVSFK